MPFYLYSHPETKEVREVFQGMNDVHSYEENGIQFDRVWTVPQAAKDIINIDPFNSRDFVKKTEAKGTMGDLMDRSKEWSEMRKGKEGFDKIKEKADADYSKKRGGKRAPSDTKVNDLHLEL